MCVCVYVHVCVCACVFVIVCAHACTLLCICGFLCVSECDTCKCVCVFVHAYACVHVHKCMHVHRLLLLWYRCLFALHTQVASQRALFAGLCAGRRGRSRLLCGLLLLWHRCLLALAALSTMLWPLSLRRLLGLCTAGGRQGRRSRLLRVRRRLLQRCRRLQWHLQSCSFN